MWSSRLLGLALGLGLLGPVGVAQVSGPVGVGSAQASEFYSRRRVNGVWITGQFSKAEVDGALRRRGVGAKPEPRVRRSALSRKAVRSRRVGWARPRSRTIDSRMPAPLEAADAAIAAVLAAAPLGVLEAVTIAAPPESRPAVSQAAAAVPDEASDTRREYLRRALETRAQDMAATLDAGSRADATPGKSADGSAAELQPISSTYDYRSQVRTTVYQNGVVIRETLESPTGPAIVTRRFVGMEWPRAPGEAATAAP